MNCLFLNTNFALKLRGKCWKDDVVTFTAHLSVTIKRLTRSKQKEVLAAMLEGKSMPSNMAANTNHTTLLKKQSAIKCLPLMHFPSNFGCKIIFMCSVNFGISKNSTHCLKEALVTWPLRASGLLLPPFLTKTKTNWGMWEGQRCWLCLICNLGLPSFLFPSTSLSVPLNKDILSDFCDSLILAPATGWW